MSVKTLCDLFLIAAEHRLTVEVNINLTSRIVQISVIKRAHDSRFNGFAGNDMQGFSSPQDAIDYTAASAWRSYIWKERREKKRDAHKLGAKVVERLPDVGGGAFGAMRMAKIVRKESK